MKVLVVELTISLKFQRDQVCFCSSLLVKNYRDLLAIVLTNCVAILTIFKAASFRKGKKKE